MQRRRVNRYLVGSWFFGWLILFTFGMSSAQGEFLKYTYAPRVLHVNLDKNIIVVVLFGENPEYVIQRLDTGKRLWSIPDQDVEVQFGNDAVSITRKGSIQVLDKATGRELWSESGEHLNEFGYDHFIGNTKWIVVRPKGYIAVYAPDGQPYKPSIPGKPVTRINVIGWLQDNKTLLLTVLEEKKEEESILTVYFWVPESNKIEESYVFSSEGRPYLFGIFPDNRAAYWQYMGDHRKEKIVLIDALTGEEQKTFDNKGRFNFTEKGYLVTTNEILNNLAVLDMKTVETITTISEPEHTFWLHTRITDSEKGWIISRDKEHRYWLWPIEEDSRPRLIYTPPAGDYFPGSIVDIRSPHVFFYTGQSKKDAYLLDGMVHVKSWRTEGISNRIFTDKICSNLNRILAFSVEGRDEKGKEIHTTQIYEAFNPHPLCTLSGYPRGISPNGRYCFTQCPIDGPVSLIKIDSSKICTVVENENKHNSPSVVFSPDNRVAVIRFSSGRNTLVSLEEPYTQKTIKGGGGLVFSPDGRFYALPGTGEAKLYDLVTDRLIHTFVEPVKVQRRHETPPDGFLETAGRFGRNILGTFVPGQKETPWVNCKFSEDSKQLITTASGKVLRVWDVKSGKLVRTIYTKLAEERNEKGYIRNSLVLSQNGSYAFAFNYDGFGTSSLWDVKTGRRIAKDYLPKGEIKHVSVADDGSGVYMTMGGRIYFVAGKKK